MDFHKPKAPHNWGELAREVGVIVIGILIALSLEEALQTLNDRHTAAEARSAVRAEIAGNLTDMQSRLATQACVKNRLAEIGDLLARTQEGELSPQPQWVGQPSIWFVALQRWQAALGSGRASLFDTEEQGHYAAIYARTAQYKLDEDREQEAWAQLRALENWRGPLGMAGKVRFSEALQQARYALWVTNANLLLTLDEGKAIGIAPKPANEASVPHSICLPMDTPRVEALRQLGDDRLGQPR